MRYSIVLWLLFVAISPLRAEERVVYVFTTFTQGQLELVVNGRKIPVKDHEGELNRAFMLAGGRGARAILMLGEECKIETFWNFRGLLLAIGFSVQTYSVNGGSMVELILADSKVPVPSGILPPSD